MRREVLPSAVPLLLASLACLVFAARVDVHPPRPATQSDIPAAVISALTGSETPTQHLMATMPASNKTKSTSVTLTLKSFSEKKKYRYENIKTIGKKYKSAIASTNDEYTLRLKQPSEELNVIKITRKGRHRRSQQCIIPKETSIEMGQKLNNLFSKPILDFQMNAMLIKSECATVSVSGLIEVAQLLREHFIGLSTVQTSDSRFIEIKQNYNKQMEALEKKFVTIHSRIKARHLIFVSDLIENIFKTRIEYKKTLNEWNNLLSELQRKVSMKMNSCSVHSQEISLYDSPAATLNALPLVSASSEVKCDSPGSTSADMAELEGILDDIFRIASNVIRSNTYNGGPLTIVSSNLDCDKSTSKIKNYIFELQNTLSNVIILNYTNYELLNKSLEMDISEMKQLNYDTELLLTQNCTHTKNTLILEQTLRLLKSNVTALQKSNQKMRVTESQYDLRGIRFSLECGDVPVAQKYQAPSSSQEWSSVIAPDQFGNLKYVENVLTYISDIPTVNNQSIAYKSFFEELHKLDNSDVLILTYSYRLNATLQKFLLHNNMSSISKEKKKKIENLNVQFDPFVQTVIDSWSRKIRDENLITISDGISVNEALKHHLPTIISKAYAHTVQNTGKIITFIKYLQNVTNDSFLTGYEVLYDEIKANSHLDSSEFVMWAYNVKAAVQNNETNQNNETKFENLKSNIPDGLQRFLWNNNSELESSQHTGYSLYGSTPGNVYTYPDCNYQDCLNQRWKIHVVENGRYFKLENVRNGNFLYADAVGRAYCTNRENGLMDWQVVPLESGSEFYFVNRATGRILDANKLVNCASSKECCCSKVQAYDYYTGNLFQRWKIL